MRSPLAAALILWLLAALSSAHADASDTERRALSSALLYQSKISGGQRQAGNAFACGFATNDCIDAAHSVAGSYTPDYDAKLLIPVITSGGGTAQSGTGIENGHYTYGGVSYTAANAVDANSSTYWASAETSAGVAGVSYVGIDLGAGNSANLTSIDVIQAIVNGPLYTRPVASVRVYLGDGSLVWTEVAGSPFTVPLDETVKSLSWPSQGAKRAIKVMANASPIAGGYAWGVRTLTANAAGTANGGLTVRFNPVPLAATVTTVRVFMEVYAADALSSDPNQDIEFDVSCDGGVSFAAASLTNLGPVGQAGRLLLESAVTTCPNPGASVAGIVKTFNGKRTQPAGFVLTAQ